MSAPAPGRAAADWWVCDGPLPAGGQKVIGPFATQELALSVRTYVEKAEGRSDLWVDDEEREPQPAPGLTAAVAQLADEMHAEALKLMPPTIELGAAPDLADQIRREVLREYAGRIRALLDTP